jgi:predicted amidohydrolase
MNRAPTGSRSSAIRSSPIRLAVTWRKAGEREQILVARCEPSLIETVRRNWPFLRDRRIDAYAPILERYLAG